MEASGVERVEGLLLWGWDGSVGVCVCVGGGGGVFNDLFHFLDVQRDGDLRAVSEWGVRVGDGGGGGFLFRVQGWGAEEVGPFMYYVRWGRGEGGGALSCIMCANVSPSEDILH